MSQTVLGALRRRLAALLQTAPLDRPGTAPSSTPSLRSDGGEREDADHLRGVPDGAGCTEIWEHLSERQAPDAEARADD